jgi:hypothetical protein
MHAQPGDWLMIRSGSDSRASRRAVILAVAPGGVPPYKVRWTDTGHEGLLFPGPDAEVVSAARQEEHDMKQAEHAAHVQAEIAARK